LKIWQRYFIKELLKIFIFFIISFYSLYILIDFSSHAGTFHHHHIKIRFSEIALYYLGDLVKRFDVLVPFALMIATVKTLSTLNTRNELVALMASGIKLKTLLRPFLLTGFLFVSLLYLNTEFLLPKSLNTLKQIEDARSSQKKKPHEQFSVEHLILEDGSTLIFQKYDSSQQIFSDVYWIRNLDDLYHFKSLKPDKDNRTSMGYFVEHFVRSPEGQIVHAASFPSLKIAGMHFDSARLLENLTSAEELSLSALQKKITTSMETQSEKHAQNLTVFYYKLAIPWLCLLAVILPAPFCVRISRQLPLFFIYAGCIFGLVSIYLIFDAALILGKRQAIEPFIAIGAPFSLFLGYFGFRYAMLK